MWVYPPLDRRFAKCESFLQQSLQAAGRPASILLLSGIAWMAASLAVEGDESRDWLTVFDEQFADNPHQRFKILRVPGTTPSVGSGRYDEARHAYSLEGHLSLVRPVRAGAHAELSLTLRFEPPRPDAVPDQKTDLMLLLFDETVAGIQVQRARAGDAPTIVRFIREKSGRAPAQVLKEITMPGAPPDGTWLLRYRHGLLTLVQGDKTVASADLALLGIQVAGVAWIQKGGAAACEQMTLKAEPFRELTAADQQTLLRASQLNAESKRLLREKQADRALRTMEQASAIYLKVHGENHHDSANSFTNLAYILEAAGKRDEAGKLLAKALAIHEATLGSAHPHTTLTRFNLGWNYSHQGDRAKARELWTQCRDDWRSVLGPDYPLAKSLDSLLPAF